MRKLRLLSLLAVLAATLFGATPNKPKLVLTIVLDQFRYDYLTRFHSEFKDGFQTLLTRGAVFTNARYVHFPTVTAVGHSTILTGATPSFSGIVGNEWFDRDEGTRVTSVSDSATRLLGGTGEGASPRRLLVDTIGDELKLATGGKSHVIGISMKDRAAILPAGHMADAAYWFDTKTGNFVSSTYYFDNLPEWVARFNKERPISRYRGAAWLGHKMPEEEGPLAAAIPASPFGNELLERFAECALDAEPLGRDEYPDVLTVSFSAHDYVGHSYGPHSPEEHDVTLRADKLLAALLRAADRRVGLDNVLVVLTADHGVAPAQGPNKLHGMPGGNIPGNAVRNAVTEALTRKYGEGNWILASTYPSIYLNYSLAAQKGLDLREVRRVAADAAQAVPHIARVYTRDQLAAGQFPPDETSSRMSNGFNVRRSGDLEYVAEPYWIFGSAITTHGSSYGYDTHVPVIFMGTGIRAGRYDDSVVVNDVAPTLATILEVETPGGSIGRVLTEMWR